jgi:hypothetical protein
MNDHDAKVFIAALAKMTPKERAAAWRKLSTDDCAVAWAALTPEERKADAAALDIAFIDAADDPAVKARRQDLVETVADLAGKGLIADSGRRDGHVVRVAAEYAGEPDGFTPEQNEVALKLRDQ